MEQVLNYFSDFTPTQLQQFNALGGLYKEWNEKINVISRKDIDHIYDRHILHSLAIAAVMEFQPGMEILDLGTGGGFPGVPLAIYFPEVKFHLVDSIGKKLKVVDSIASEIGLTNITTQHSRVEDIRNRKFDFVVSRAVAPLRDLWTWAKPVLKKELTSKSFREMDLSVFATESGDQHVSGLTTPGRPGLVCLKGGDLNIEIQESGLRPRLMEIKDIFDMEYFEQKFVVYVPRG